MEDKTTAEYLFPRVFGVEAYRDHRRQGRTRLQSFVSATRQMFAPGCYALEQRIRNSSSRVSLGDQISMVSVDAIKNIIPVTPLLLVGFSDPVLLGSLVAIYGAEYLIGGGMVSVMIEENMAQMRVRKQVMGKVAS